MQTQSSTRTTIYTNREGDNCHKRYALAIVTQSRKPKDHPCSEHLVRKGSYQLPIEIADLINKIEASGFFSFNDSQQTEGMINYQFSTTFLPNVRALIREFRRRK